MDVCKYMYTCVRVFACASERSRYLVVQDITNFAVRRVRLHLHTIFAAIVIGILYLQNSCRFQTFRLSPLTFFELYEDCLLASAISQHLNKPTVVIPKIPRPCSRISVLASVMFQWCQLNRKWHTSPRGWNEIIIVPGRSSLATGGCNSSTWAIWCSAITSSNSLSLHFGSPQANTRSVTTIRCGRKYRPCSLKTSTSKRQASFERSTCGRS